MKKKDRMILIRTNTCGKIYFHETGKVDYDELAKKIQNKIDENEEISKETKLLRKDWCRICVDGTIKFGGKGIK